MSGKFVTEVPGKWVLAGEHTVLRGGTAIALPHPDLRLRLEYRPGDGPLTVEPDLATPMVHELFGVARDWFRARGKSIGLPRGVVTLASTIPFGAGLGSSAAFSVALARWVLDREGLPAHSDAERELAREFEHRFHGRSSGMDIAVVSLAQPIRFTMAEGATPLELRRLPRFVFRDSGLRAATRECIARVNALRADDPVRGERLDAEMSRAATEILAGLADFDRNDEESARALIAAGMARAGEVFAEWGLVPPEVHAQLAELEGAGIRSPRLTGAGGGGFIVGLAP